VGINREEVLRRFEEWLDVALAAEEPPRGIEAEILEALADGGAERARPESAGEYGLRAAVTALAQEVKLQGRSFKELTAALGGQAARMAEREREDLRRETERRCRKEALGLLIDLRDRLGRGWESARTGEAGIAKAALPGLWRRLFPRPAEDPAAEVLAALKKGYELAIERLDQALEDFDARQIPCQGQVFDPRRMNAVDRQESSAVPEGTVIEVYRSGYEWNGDVFRPAQVKVSCAPAEKVNE